MNTTTSPKRTNKKDKSGVVIKLCIIGAGKMGTTRIDVTNKSAKLQCIAVVETDKTNSVWSNPPVGSDGHAIDVFADLSEVKERIDAVCICTPTKTHADLITQAVERKVKFIFCEAPIAWSEDEVRACYKMCKEHGVFLFCGWYRRFDPDFTSLFDLYQGSHLVSVKFVDKLCCKFTLHRKAEKKAQSALEKANSTPVMLHSDSLLSHCDSSIASSMCNINESLTSSLSQNDSTVTSSQSLSSDVPETTTPKQLDLFRECLAHDINLALMFMNDQAPVSVQVIARDTFGTGSYDNAYCNLEYPGGKSLLIELSKYSKRYENSIRLVADGQVVVCGKKNIIFLEPSESRHSNDTQEDLTTDEEEEEEEDEDDDDNEEKKKEEIKTITENDNTTTTKSDENISEKDNSLINLKTSVKSSSKQRHYDSERYADAMARQMDHFAEICRKDKVPVRYGTDACTLTAQIVQLAEKSVILGSKVFFSEGPVMKILQAGTCGTAQYVHDNVLARLPQCKALATYPNPPSEENEGVEGAEVLPADLRKAIETPEINGVYVCLPPKSKIACVQACLGLRKKVLCQTPVTDFFALQQLAAQKDSFFMIDFPRRFDKKLLRAKEKVTQIEVEGGMFESLAIEDRDPELADNAPEAIWGSVVHDVDLLSWLLENVDCEITVESAGPGPEPHSLVVVFVVWLQRYDRTVKATIHHVAGSDVFVNTVTVNGDVFGHDARKKKLRYSLSAYYDDAYACMFKSFAKRPVNAPGQGLFCRTYARTFKLVEGILDILVDDADMYVSGDASSDVANAVVAAATRTPLATPVIAIADSASSSSLFGNVTITTTTVPTSAASSEPMGKVSCDEFELGTSTEDYDDDSDTDTDTDSDTDGEGNNGSNSSEIVLNISKTPEALSNGGVDEHLPVLNLQAIEKHKSVTPTMSPTKESSATPVEEDDGIIVAKLWGADDSKSAAGEPPSPQAGFLSTPKMVPQQQQAQQAQQQQQQQAQPIAPSPRRQRNGGIRRKKSSKQGSPSPAGSISGSISGAGVIRKEGVVYKPAVYDENALSVYEHIREHIPGLMRFVPRVTGRIVVAGSPCIAVEDLAQQYKRPAYLDLKLGEPGDFMRIHRQPYSMRVTRHSGLKGTDALPVNKHQQSWNDLVMYFRDFLRDGRTGCTRYDVIPSLIEQLREIYDVFESQTSLRMRAASLRFIYEVSESDDPSPPTVRLVDLARVKILGEASKDEESGESPAGAGNGGGGDDEDVSLPVYASVDDVDHFFCFGILNAINLLNSIRDEFVTRNALFLCRDDLSRHQRPKFRTADEQATFIANRLANENVSVVVSQPGSTAVSISRKVAELLGVKYIVLQQLSLLCDPSTSKADEPKEEEEVVMAVDDDPLFDRETSAAVATGMEGLSAGESFISLQKAVVPAFIKVCGKYTRLAVVGDEAVLKSLLSILVGHKWKTHLKFKSILSLVPSTTSALGWIIERINVPNPFFHKSKIEKS